LFSIPTLNRNLTGRFYHPELDPLRFFAFFLAFLHHSLPHHPEFYLERGVAPPLAHLLSGIGATGSFGVNLFFLMSAYLITELLIREQARFGHIDLRAFYIRRTLRIWPLYFFFLAIAWSLQWYVPTQHIGWRAQLAYIFLAGNWWVVFVGFPPSVIYPLWSLSVEEQFYIVWPAIMRRMGARGMIAAAVGMLAAASLTRWYLAVRNTWEMRIWTNTFVQLDCIALGILLALFLAGRSPRFSSRTRTLLVVAGIACFAIAGNYFRIKNDPLTPARVMLGYPTMAVGAVLWFLGVLRPENRPANPVLVYLGRISYSLFVFHALGLMIADYSIPSEDSTLPRLLCRNLLAFVLTLGMAAASYRWVEMPFLALKQRFAHILSRPGG
jgi:peptidoglycan/LPS O-acetylase OafA/YrhL